MGPSQKPAPKENTFLACAHFSPVIPAQAGIQRLVDRAKTLGKHRFFGRFLCVFHNSLDPRLRGGDDRGRLPAKTFGNFWKAPCAGETVGVLSSKDSRGISGKPLMQKDAGTEAPASLRTALPERVSWPEVASWVCYARPGLPSSPRVRPAPPALRDSLRVLRWPEHPGQKDHIAPLSRSRRIVDGRPATRPASYRARRSQG